MKFAPFIPLAGFFATGEIGPIRLKRNNIGRGKERVEIHLAGES